jgi:hypothetical protein
VHNARGGREIFGEKNLIEAQLIRERRSYAVDLRSVSTGFLIAADELAERALTAAANFFCAKVACDQLLFSTSVRGRTSRHQTAE